MSRHKSYCTIKVLDHGPAEFGDHFRIEVRSSYSDEWLDDFKRQVFSVDRRWDEDERAWYVTGEYTEDLEMLAIEHFEHASLVEGDFTTDLKTGEVRQQASLF
jgi:hypothetical protein